MMENAECWIMDELNIQHQTSIIRFAILGRKLQTSRQAGYIRGRGQITNSV
jgi:hypothetical protein